MISYLIIVLIIVIVGLVAGYFANNMHKVDKDYSELIEKQLDKYGIVKVGYCTSFVGDIKIWTNNYPYAYGVMYDDDYGAIGGYPTMRVRRKINRAVQDFILNEMIKKNGSVA